VEVYGLAGRAKEAVARRVNEMSFGTRAECEDYMQRVQKALLAVANQKQITTTVKLKLGALYAPPATTAMRPIRSPPLIR